MFETPLDAWYVWFGLAAASAAAFGTIASLPTAAPPDAGGAADTVDSVAAADHAATGEHPLDADRVKVGPHRLALRGDAGTSRASFAYGPVTPVAPDSALESVLHGASLERAFDSRRAFEQAVIDARTREPGWRTADRTLLVRTVSWGTTDVTLVGV